VYYPDPPTGTAKKSSGANRSLGVRCGGVTKARAAPGDSPLKPNNLEVRERARHRPPAAPERRWDGVRTEKQTCSLGGCLSHSPPLFPRPPVAGAAERVGERGGARREAKGADDARVRAGGKKVVGRQEAWLGERQQDASADDSRAAHTAHTPRSRAQHAAAGHPHAGAGALVARLARAPHHGAFRPRHAPLATRPCVVSLAWDGGSRCTVCVARGVVLIVTGAERAGSRWWRRRAHRVWRTATMETCGRRHRH